MVVLDGGAHLFGEADKETDIVNREEGGAEGFAATDEVVEVSADVILAGVAVASGIERGEIGLKLGVFEIDAVLFELAFGILADAWDKSVTVARETGRGDAVENVDAELDALDKVDWLAHAHEVTDVISGEIRGGVFDGFVHVIFRFAVVSDATDCIAVEADFDGFFGGVTAQVGVWAALDNAEKVLLGVVVDGFATLSPAEGALDAVFEILVIGGGWWALVEAHGDVAVELILDLDGFFRGEKEFATIELGFKMDALFGDVLLFVVSEAENLVAARVGEDGSVPIHKLMEAAGLGDDFWGGTEPEVVSISEDDARVAGFDLFGAEGFDGSLSADWHKHRGFIFLSSAVRSGENQLAVASAGLSVLVEELILGFHGRLDD